MKKIVYLLIAVLVLLVACQTQVEFTPTLTTQKPSNTLTTAPISTITPTAEADSALPVTESITLENIDQLQELAQWGYGKLLDVVLSPDETQVVAVTTLGVYWFDAGTLEELDFRPYTFDKLLSQVKISPTVGTFAYTVKEEENSTITDAIYLVDMKSWKTIQTITDLEISPYESFWYSPDGDQLYINSSYNYFIVWNIERSEQNILNLIDDHWYESFEFFHNGRGFVIGEFGRIKMFDDSDEPTIMVADKNANATFIAASEDGRYIARAGWYHGASIQIVDTQTEEVLFEDCLAADGCPPPDTKYDDWYQIREAGHCPCDHMAYYVSRTESGEFTPDNKYLIPTTDEECGAAKYLYQIDLQSTTITAKVEIPQTGKIIPFSDNTRFIIWKNGLSLYSVSQEEPIATVKNRFSYSEWIQFSPDSQSLGASSWDGTFRLYDVRSGQETHQQSFFHKPSTFSFMHNSNEIIFANWTTFNITALNLDSNTITPISEEPICFLDDQYLSADDALLLISPWRDYDVLYSIAEDAYEYLENSRIRFHPTDTELIIEEDGFHFYNYQLSLSDSFLDILQPENCLQWGYLPDGDGFYCAKENRLAIIRENGTQWISTGRYSIDWGLYSRAMDAGIEFTPDLTILFGFDEINYRVGIFDTESGDFIDKLDFIYSVIDIDLSPDGKYLAVSTTDGLIHIYGVPR